VVILDGADRLEVRAVDRRPGTPVPAAGEPSGAILDGAEWTELLSSGQPILHVGGGDDPRARPAQVARDLLGLDPTAPLALVPLGTGPRSIGLLVTGWDHEQEAGARDVLPIQAIHAVQAGVAILAAQSNVDRGRLALLEERERIARDMHDNVIQRLFATGLSLQSATPLAVHPVVRARLNRAVDELDTAIKEIRQAIFELHTEDPGASLDTTLAAIAQSYAASLGFAPDVSVAAGLGPLPEALRADVVAVAREGLANVARHAHARSVALRVTGDAGLSVDVVDDGSGFDPERARSGLVNLRERAAAHGGELEIRSAPGAGTVLHWHVPRD
jgi:signal transduction histidine kinase